MDNVMRIIFLFFFLLVAINCVEIKNDVMNKDEKGNLRVVLNENENNNLHEKENVVTTDKNMAEVFSHLENEKNEIANQKEVAVNSVRDIKKKEQILEKPLEVNKEERVKVNFIETMEVGKDNENNVNSKIVDAVVNDKGKEVTPEKEGEKKTPEPVKEIIIIGDGHVTGVTNEESLKNIVETEMNLSKSEANDLINEMLHAESEDSTGVKQSNLYVLQILGFMSSIFMQMTLCPAIIKILQKKTTGELDALPFVMLFYSSFLWLVYGMLIDNTGVVLPNFSGLLLGFLYTVAYHKNCKSMWLKQKLYSYYKICSTITFFLYIFIYFTTFSSYVFTVGLLAAISSVVNFGAPLSSIKEVIKKQDTSSIPAEMAAGSLICSFIWLCYGLMLKDAFLIIPNLGGFVLGLMQLCLIIMYYDKPVGSFNTEENLFAEEKGPINHESVFFPNPKVHQDNRANDISITEQDSFFQFTYDETSPLTVDFNYKKKPEVGHNMDLVKSSDSVDPVTALNF